MQATESSVRFRFHGLNRMPRRAAWPAAEPVDALAVRPHRARGDGEMLADFRVGKAGGWQLAHVGINDCLIGTHVVRNHREAI